MDDPFDAPADDGADDMFDMPVGDDDNIGDDFGGDDDGLGLGDDIAVEEEKEAEQEEDEQKEEKVVDNTPKVSEELLKFQADWRNRCIEMDKLAGEKKKELQDKAKESLKDFAKQRESHTSKRKASNRENEKDFLEQMQSEKESGNPWARVVNMIDTKEDADGMDVSRMKSILIQLKSRPLKKE